MKKIIRYKFLRTGLKSENGNLHWKIGKWEKVDGELDMCNWGLHACKKPYYAFSYIQGEILAQVECRGEHLVDNDKECWREQRIVKAWKWTKKDSVKLAIYSAELVIDIFEKEFSNDDRPRKAIEAAKKWLKNPTDKNRAAAGAAAWAARAAAGAAAEAAAWAAAGAAAWAAVWAVAWAVAWAAVWAAEAAGAAAGAAAIKKIIKFFDSQVKQLKEI